ncbi:hypothetical protein CRENBAI_010050 [Crenichthys baileyi]|uniref:Uncharacterized protein n=1 Tax=Crenichthys baileyi TaxID=28760 RepID=A0AAV9S6H1_9TELE
MEIHSRRSVCLCQRGMDNESECSPGGNKRKSQGIVFRDEAGQGDEHPNNPRQAVTQQQLLLWVTRQDTRGDQLNADTSDPPPPSCSDSTLSAAAHFNPLSLDGRGEGLIQPKCVGLAWSYQHFPTNLHCYATLPSPIEINALLGAADLTVIRLQ